MNFGQALVSECLQLIWPAHCAGCDVLLASDDAIFCGLCAQAVNPIARACGACALPQWGPAWAPCAGCVRHRFPFSRAVAGFEYGESIAAAIIRMKHGDRPDLARRLSRLLREPMRQALGGITIPERRGGRNDNPVHEAGSDATRIPPVDLVVPVPLHPRKLRRRGFNQALELARGALSGLNIGAGTSTAPRPRLEHNLLRRIRDTRELGRSGPRERRDEIRGAFAVATPSKVFGRRVLIVDDVMTTGTTFGECGAVLLAAGALEIRVLALARAIG